VRPAEGICPRIPRPPSAMYRPLGKAMVKKAS
jgi:hypothetical protein